MVYLLAGTITPISSNGYGILRVEAIIDDGNTASPTYSVRLANEEYGNENDALAAIVEERETEGAHIAVADGAYSNMEPAK